MPEIFRFYGFSFFFYSKEHEPLHVHVEGKGGCAKFDLVDDEFVMVEKINIKANDLKNLLQPPRQQHALPCRDHKAKM